MHERRERERESSQETRAETSDDQRAGDGPWGTLGWARARGNYTEEYSERTTTASANPREQPIILDKPVNTVRTAPNRPDTRLMTLRLGCIVYGRSDVDTASLHAYIL